MAEAPFERIAREYREKIMRGELKPGDKLPAQQELTERHGIARATATRVVGQLKAWGLVETVVGSGTRVVEVPPVSGPEQHTERGGRGDTLYDPGEHPEFYEAPGVMTTDLVSADVLRAVDLPIPSRRVAGEVTSIVRRPRVIIRDDKAVAVCRTWFPHFLIVQQGRAGDAVLEKLTSTERIVGGTARLLCDLYGVEIDDVTYRFGLRAATPSIGRELLVEPGTVLLWYLVIRRAGEYVIEVDEWFRQDDVTI